MENDCAIPTRRRSRPAAEKGAYFQRQHRSCSEAPQQTVEICKAWSEITSAKFGSLDIVISIDEGVGRSILPHFIEP